MLETMLDPRLLKWQVHGWHLTELVPPTGKKIGVEFPIAISLKKTNTQATYSTDTDDDLDQCTGQDFKYEQEMSRSKYQTAINNVLFMKY